MLEAYRLGGWGMYPTTIVGVLMLAVSVLYAVKPQRRFVPLIITTNVMTIVSGTLGFVTGLIHSAAYMDQVQNKADVPLIAVLGAGESLHNVSLALILMMLAAIAVSVGALRVVGLTSAPANS